MEAPLQPRRHPSAHTRILRCTAARFAGLMKADMEASGGLRGEIKVWPPPPGREGEGEGQAKVITAKLKGTALEWQPRPRHSSKWSHGASFAYQIVKYFPWHRPNRGLINALNQFWIAPRGVAPPGHRHYRKLWWQMRGMMLFLLLSVHLRLADTHSHLWYLITRWEFSFFLYFLLWVGVWFKGSCAGAAYPLPCFSWMKTWPAHEVKVLLEVWGG